MLLIRIHKSIQPHVSKLDLKKNSFNFLLLLNKLEFNKIFIRLVEWKAVIICNIFIHRSINRPDQVFKFGENNYGVNNVEYFDCK